MKAKLQLLELTRSGLWNSTPNPDLFDPAPNWNEILYLAKQQTLLGVIAPAIEKLPPKAQPPRATALRLHQRITLNRQFYTLHSEVLGKLIEFLKSCGAQKPVLLKGLGISQNYPDPTLRQCGDIDIYIGEENFETIWAKIGEELNFKFLPKVVHHHVDFHFLDTEIELHKYPTTKTSVAFNSTKFIEWCKEELSGDKLVELKVEDTEFLTPSADFNFIYIFYHTWRHFLTGGVGLRQFCDWCCLIDKHAEEIDREEIERLITLFKLQKPISLFATIAVKYLGLNPEKFPNYTPIDDKIADSAMERIWNRGNFGNYNKDSERRSKPFLTRKLMGFSALLRDARYLTKLDLRYSLRFYRKYIYQSLKSIIQGTDKRHDDHQ